MKKILVAILMLGVFSVFAEDVLFTVGEDMSWVDSPHLLLKKNDYISEICPIGNVCKVCYTNGVTEYIKKGDKFEIVKDRWENIPKKLVHTYTVTSFTYNEIITTETVEERDFKVRSNDR